MPWAAYLKKACPTMYTFPYDDQTSTFTCDDKVPSNDTNTHDDKDSSDDTNTQSCESFLLSLVFCCCFSRPFFFLVCAAAKLLIVVPFVHKQ